MIISNYYTLGSAHYVLACRFVDRIRRYCTSVTVHKGKRERERERQTKTNKKGELMEVADRLLQVLFVLQ
jgi:membrane-bound lytic murein transglycosylase MltF